MHRERYPTGEAEIFDNAAPLVVPVLLEVHEQRVRHEPALAQVHLLPFL